MYIVHWKYQYFKSYNTSNIKAVFGLDVSTTLNTDEAAARGASLKCAILSPTFRVREFNIVDSVQNEITIQWAPDSTGANGGSLKIFEKKGQFPFTKAMTIYRKVSLGTILFLLSDLNRKINSLFLSSGRGFKDILSSRTNSNGIRRDKS